MPMRQPHSKVKLAGRVRQRWDERYTLHANHVGCMLPVYSSIYG